MMMMMMMMLGTAERLSAKLWKPTEGQIVGCEEDVCLQHSHPGRAFVSKRIFYSLFERYIKCGKGGVVKARDREREKKSVRKWEMENRTYYKKKITKK